jgi:acyl carrier protein
MTVTKQLEPIFHQVFDDDSIRLRPDLTADQVDGWDSLSHVNLIVAIENRFRIKFTQKELLTFRNVGDLVRAIAAKAELPQ